MIYICVLNYCNPKDTIPCLDSLLQLKDAEYRILLLDNASSDDSQEILAKYAALHQDKVVFFPLKRNLGYAGGNNIGLRYAMSQGDMEYAWILNNDTLVEPDALSWLVRYMDQNPHVGMCGSKLIYEWDRSRVQGYGGKYVPWIGVSSTYTEETDIPRIDYVIGAAIFVRRSFLEDIGLMCEDYFLYFEETDWAVRARGRYSLGCEPRSVVYHREGAVIGANAAHPDEKSELADYYAMRNRLLFTRKYYPQCLPTVYLSSLIMIWNRFRRHQYPRMWMFVKLLLGIKDKKYEM